MGNRVLFATLRAALVVLPRVPLALLYIGARVAGTLAFYLFPSPRRGILVNLHTAFPGQDPRWYGRTARAAFRHDALNWTDTIRIARTPATEIARSVEVEGWERLRDALALGRGVILLSAHVGNFDLVGQVIAGSGLALTVPVERIEPPELYDFLLSQRESKGITLVPVERAPRAMVAALKRGEIVGVVADRVVTGKTLTVPFFGKPTKFPRGLASLVRHSGAPVLVGVGLRRKGGFNAFITPPLSFPSSGNPSTTDTCILAEIACCTEAAIRRAPEQWLAFSPIWPEDGRTGTAATMEHNTEAAV